MGIKIFSRVNLTFWINKDAFNKNAALQCIPTVYRYGTHNDKEYRLDFYCRESVKLGDRKVMYYLDIELVNASNDVFLYERRINAIGTRDLYKQITLWIGRIESDIIGRMYD